MTESKTPWHIWAVGIVSLLWNAMGAMDFAMSNLQTESYMAQFADVNISDTAGTGAVIFTVAKLMGAVLVLLYSKAQAQAGRLT